MVRTTSSLGRRWVSSKACCQGTSGSFAPCRMRTGHPVSMVEPSTRCLRPVLDQRARDRPADRRTRRGGATRPWSRSHPGSQARTPFHIRSSVKSGAGAIRIKPASEAASWEPACPALLRASSVRAPTAAPSIHPWTSRPRSAAPRRTGRTPRGSPRPAADGAVDECAAGSRRAPNNRNECRPGLSSPPIHPAPAPWCPSCPRRNHRARTGPGEFRSRGAHRDAPRALRRADIQEDRCFQHRKCCVKLTALKMRTRKPGASRYRYSPAALSLCHRRVF